MGRISQRLNDLHITLPQPPRAAANYAPWQRAGDLVFISGQLTFENGAIRYPGRVGAELSIEEGKAAARLCCLNLLAQMSAACDGDLDRISQVVRIGCFLAVAENFTEHPPVLNGASDLVFDIFGPQIGNHTRFAASAHILPLNSPIMIEGVVYLGK
ncbi:MAG TPA: RidA family protein [Dongiaceae bacterium]